MDHKHSITPPNTVLYNTSVCIHIESSDNFLDSNGENKTYGVYVSNIIPRIGEELWVKKQTELFRSEYQTDKTASKSYFLKVINVIYDIKFYDNNERVHDIHTVYIICDEIDH